MKNKSLSLLTSALFLCAGISALASPGPDKDIQIGAVDSNIVTPKVIEFQASTSIDRIATSDIPQSQDIPLTTLDPKEGEPKLLAQSFEQLQFSILSYNVMFLSSVTFPNHRQEHRAKEIPEAISRAGTWDLIVINEAFENSARSILITGLLQKGYPFVTSVVDKANALEDGGVFIQSRLPILATDSTVFSDCSGTDCLSNKGAIYVKVQKNGRIVHVFGTHLQSSRGATEARIRSKQLAQLRNFIQQKAPNAEANGEVIVVAGDLNFDDLIDRSEYQNALSTLNATLYGSRPSGYTFDPVNNSVAKYRYEGENQEWLDYILVGSSGSNPAQVNYSVMKLRSSTEYNMPAVGDPLGVFDGGTDHFDLSDHYGLSANFDFPAIAASAPASTPPSTGNLTSDGVNGRNVVLADFAGGRFQQTQPGVWQEFNAAGEVTFNFQETGRDDWSVYLNDPSRDLQIQIDIHRKMISWGQNNGPRSDLYPIVSTARQQ